MSASIPPAVHAERSGTSPETAYRPSALGSGESHRTCAGVPVLRYARPGRDREAPLIIFFTGAGHLARVAYGHPGANPADFLDHWLERQGFGLLALSYPGGHPAMPSVIPDLTISRWADAIAEAALEGLGPNRGVILLAWSMGVRVAGQCAVSARAKGLRIDAFIPMAGSPPIAGLSTVDAATERFFENGMWDTGGSPVHGQPRKAAWLEELGETNRKHGRTVLSAEDYEAYYLTGTPAGLMHDAALARSAGIAVPEVDLSGFPLASPIAPNGRADYRHALADGIVWGFVNTRAVQRRWLVSTLASHPIQPDDWSRLIRLSEALPQRLLRRIDGGHLFFIGESGAQATARAVNELWKESQSVQRELDALLGAVSHRPTDISLATQYRRP